jgi:hypothetical protein
MVNGRGIGRRAGEIGPSASLKGVRSDNPGGSRPARLLFDAQVSLPRRSIAASMLKVMKISRQAKVDMLKLQYSGTNLRRVWSRARR